MDAVLRLLRGEPLETLSRELGVKAHRLAAWRDEFVAQHQQLSVFGCPVPQSAAMAATVHFG